MQHDDFFRQEWQEMKSRIRREEELDYDEEVEPPNIPQHIEDDEKED